VLTALSTDSEILIKVEHLSRYYGTTCAVRDVSFEVRKGEVLGFLGPNGAGKSTTMQMLCGGLAPTSGRVEIAGIDLLDQPQQAKRQLGFLPENPPLYRDMSVDEYLRFAARLHGVGKAELGAAVTHAKARCGLTEVGNRLIGNLSKGFQQRVGIAQAIAHNPAVVVLDEPTVGLDPIQIREIRDLIRELGQDHSVILSTHILPEVQATCSRVQIINQGQLVYAESVAKLSQRLEAKSLLVHLRQPPTVTELGAIPGINAAEVLGDGKFRLHIGTGSSPAEGVAERAVSNGWGLMEITPEHQSLEQIFVELTSGDTASLAVGEVAA
jgi:ABC-2 type transport system ATP-binding protein